jgi:hypothetical protein
MVLRGPTSVGICLNQITAYSLPLRGEKVLKSTVRYSAGQVPSTRNL